MRIRARAAGLLFAMAILLAPSGSRGAVDLRSIDVRGGNADARRIASQAAGTWSRAAGPSDLDGLANAVGNALVNGGWGRGDITAALDTTAAGIVCRIRLDGIGPTRLGSWQWDPDSAGAAIRPGTWVPSRGEEQIGRLLSDLQEDGHPFASIQILSATDTSGSVAVRARLDRGRRLRLLQTFWEGRGPTRASYLDRVAGLRRGDPIRPGDSARARERIERTGLFAEVDGPWLTGITDNGGSLVYRVVPLPQNRIEGAAGYDGKSRALSGFVHLELGNLFGTGRRLNAAWERLDRHRSGLSLAYREPFLGGLPIAADVAVSQSIEDTTWTSDAVRGAVEGTFAGGMTARVGLTRERTVATLPEGTNRTSRVATILGLGYDRRSESGTRGSRVDLEMVRGNLKRSPSLASGEGSLTTLSIAGERNFLFGGRGQIRLEGLGGWVEGPDSLPRPDAMGLGGAASLRGYPEQAFRTLGYGLARVEGGIRMLPEGNRIYAFVDGALIRPWPAGATARRTGYGLGVRIRGAGGWVRLDYGIPSGSGPLAGRIHFRLETRF